MNNLKEAIYYDTYGDYCAPRKEIGLGVMPKELFDAIKEDYRNGS